MSVTENLPPDLDGWLKGDTVSIKEFCKVGYFVGFNAERSEVILDIDDFGGHIRTDRFPIHGFTMVNKTLTARKIKEMMSKK